VDASVLTVEVESDFSSLAVTLDPNHELKSSKKEMLTEGAASAALTGLFGVVG